MIVITQETTVSLQAWKKLYSSAIAFRDVKPWRWMRETDVFGVRNPVTGEIGYGVITGVRGEHLSLVLYRGYQGLYRHWQAMAGRFSPPRNAIYEQNCLMASFESRKLLKPEDLSLIKQLGLRFRGAMSWPLFRCYEPGCVPWFLNEKEVDFLHLALDQALEVAAACRNDPELGGTLVDGKILVRTPKAHGNTLSWYDEWLKFPRFYEDEQNIGECPFNELRLEKIKKMSLDSVQPWEADFFVLPIAARKGDSRPFYPCVLLVVDQQSGKLVGVDMHHYSNLQKDFQEHFLSCIERAGAVPTEVHVSSHKARYFLEPLAIRLKINLEQKKSLPRLEKAQQAILDANL